MNTPRRRRRPNSGRPSSDRPAESDRPAPRKKKSSGKKKKKPTKTKVPVGLIASVAGGVIVLIAIFTVDWKSFGRTLGLPSPHEKLAKRMLAVQSEQADILESIKDQASVKAAAPKINKVFEEIARITFDVKNLKKREKISREEDLAIKEKYEKKKLANEARIKKEMQRIKQNPALAAAFGDVIREATFARMEVTSQLRAKEAKEGFNASGYSPVTDRTKLTKGMKIEVLALGDVWTPGTVTDIASNGRVKVNFDRHKHTDAFDVYHKRDKLRIPD